jgi:hypothetical protein
MKGRRRPQGDYVRFIKTTAHMTRNKALKEHGI